MVQSLPGFLNLSLNVCSPCTQQGFLNERKQVEGGGGGGASVRGSDRYKQD